MSEPCGLWQLSWNDTRQYQTFKFAAALLFSTYLSVSRTFHFRSNDVLLRRSCPVRLSLSNTYSCVGNAKKISLHLGMETHADEHVLVRNCCLSLCQFEIPADILFNYRRAVNILLRVLRDHGHDPTTQRIVVFLLNSMACHVEGEQKVAVGDMGAVEVIPVDPQHFNVFSCLPMAL